MIECLLTKGLLKSIKIVIPLILQSLDCNFIFLIGIYGLIRTDIFIFYEY